MPAARTGVADEEGNDVSGAGAEGRPPWLHWQDRVCVPNPLAQQGPGLARVDDVLDAESLGGQ
jgi:hypothetical protein